MSVQFGVVVFCCQGSLVKDRDLSFKQGRCSWGVYTFRDILQFSVDGSYILQFYHSVVSYGWNCLV